MSSGCSGSGRPSLLSHPTLAGNGGCLGAEGHWDGRSGCVWLGPPPKERLEAGYVSTSMAAPPPPIQGVLSVPLRRQESRPRGSARKGGCELTLPVGGPRRRPRPLAADRRDPSWDAHGQGWAEMGAHSFRREAGKFPRESANADWGVKGQPGIPCVQPPRLESPRPPPRASQPAGRGAPKPRLTQQSGQGSP